GLSSCRPSSKPSEPLSSTRLPVCRRKMPASYSRVASAVTSVSCWWKVMERSTGSWNVLGPAWTVTSNRADHVWPSMSRSPGTLTGMHAESVTTRSAAARVSDLALSMPEHKVEDPGAGPGSSLPAVPRPGRAGTRSSGRGRELHLGGALLGLGPHAAGFGVAEVGQVVDLPADRLAGEGLVLAP